MGKNAWYRDPKKQIWLFLFGFLIWYLLIIRSTGWFTTDDFVRASVGLIIAFFRFFGLMEGDVFGAIPLNIRHIFRDLIIGTIVFFMGLAFYAQFVLPLHNTRERWYAFTRLFLYVIRRHGPAIAIVDGDPKISKKEAKKKGRGVIRLDTASAAVLRTETKFTQTVGPGTVFTTRGERVGNAFSLQLQSKLVGPYLHENPFDEKPPVETEQELEMRRQRRFETRGVTRDGVEVVPTLITVFRLNNEPNLGKDQTAFGFNPHAIWAANGREGIDPEKGADTKQHQVSWDWLPAYIAVEVWREYLGKYTLDELFIRKGQKQAESGIEKIQRLTNARLTEPRVEQVNRFGKTTGLQKDLSKEYIRLRERGLKVERVIITNFHFPDEVEHRLLELWKDSWPDQARMRASQTQKAQGMKRVEGERGAIMEFADKVTQKLGHEVQNAPSLGQAPDLARSLQLLVWDTVDLTSDERLLTRTATEKKELQAMMEWIRSK